MFTIAVMILSFIGLGGRNVGYLNFMPMLYMMKL